MKELSAYYREQIDAIREPAGSCIALGILCVPVSVMTKAVYSTLTISSTNSRRNSGKPMLSVYI